MRGFLQSRRAVPALGLVAALLVACGGGDGSDDAASDPAEQESADSAPTESGPDDDVADGGSADASVGSLEELFARYGDSLGRPGQVVYEWEAAGVGSGARMTMAQDPPNMAYLIESSDGSFHTITGDVNVVCFETGGAWQCMSSDSGMADMFGGNPMDDVYDFEDVEASGLDPATVTLSADTIVGRSATCMSVAESDGVSNLVMCLDDETGMMLRTSGDTADGSFSMEAVAFSAPDPALFVPPGEIMEFPGMPTG